MILCLSALLRIILNTQGFRVIINTMESTHTYTHTYNIILCTHTGIVWDDDSQNEF